MTELFDVAAIGNAIVDVIAPADEGFIAGEGLSRGAMTLVDEARGRELYARMAPGVETSGGSAANTVAGLSSLGARTAFLGKVADDQLGEVFAHDLRAIGAHFPSQPLRGGPATARCLVNVTPDGQRTMCTFLGASVEFTDDDIDPAVIEQASIVYLEGYLFDAEAARRAFAKAAGLARASGRMIALTLSDGFVVERHRSALLGFISSQVDLLFANEAEALALFETDDLAVALDGLRQRTRLAAVTRSEKGSLLLADGGTVSIPARAVEKVVDTTGAGDQYAAGVMYGLARGRPLEVCGHLGSLAAAEVISHYGPRPQVSLRELADREGL
ncbi:MAG: adenosine kinase [Phenylobacterium sp.]|uniref:adenosine kinase n=2 Tax=Phenylobacterium sp. TaxID=1871053 RepID=UPI0025E93DFB|nr:adenosine kinase [Phenylobacterium sp.]MCA6224021.1 adenosine kinase [Phenylobacterium sp.]MCA6232207.1 adenosine kinase [Phenylobacterium sp.]MCA6248677.1 adenosine kinase [Phenylobacterium sp.]MCA6252935.1 adenosine kinase [Phenylobacterium sp.]MCA6257714.1 adenosine kinase [Phenylobacterium sp.]